MQPDEPNDEERLEQLPEDGQTPFSPADAARDPDADPDDERQIEEKIDDTHPSTDDSVQPEEVYEGGLASAAGASEPNAGNSVVGYAPSVSDDTDDEATEDDNGKVEDVEVS